METKDEKLLNDKGWEVECESPFEIRTKDGSFASNEAAYIVLEALKHTDVTAVQHVSNLLEIGLKTGMIKKLRAITTELIASTMLDELDIPVVLFSEAEVCEHHHPKQYNPDKKGWECIGCNKVVWIMKTKGRFFWKQTWFSFCSKHQDYDPNCKLCQGGSWKNSWLHSMGNLIHDNCYSLWYWWVNK